MPLSNIGRTDTPPPPAAVRVRTAPRLQRLVLASASTRRRALLAEAGYHHDTITPAVDDGELMHAAAAPPSQWVTGLAYLKGRSVVDTLTDDNAPHAVVLSADTIVVKDGRLIGKPAEQNAAADTIKALCNGSHSVITGASIIRTDTGERRLLCDAAHVTVGDISETTINAYIQGGTWRGKAGAYNLRERIDDGWPITFEGDAATIMGLPMARIVPILDSMLANRTAKHGGNTPA